LLGTGPSGEESVGRFETMIGWRQWLDWIVVALGVILVVVGLIAAPMCPLAVPVFGGLLVVVGLLLLANPRAIWGEGVQVALAVLLFISPWVFGFQDLAPINWFAWVIGHQVMLAAGSALVIGDE
jgi:SPW repeat